MLVDVHCHMTYESFEKGIDEVIEKCKKKGVSAIITNGTDPKDNRKVLEMAKKHSIVKAALGLYPITALKMSDKEIDEELKFIESQKEKIVAIGEVGLDYHWEKDEKQHKREKEIFRKIIALAEKIKKPLIVHSRNAESDVLELLKNCKTKVVLHMFSGNMELVEKAISMDFYFTIPTTILRSRQFRKMAKKIGINKILTETDAPYLGIDGERNDPSNVALTIKKIAEIKGFEEEEVKKNIWMNYQKVFS